ncbi:MAG: septum site-determining protein MinD [Chloroflexi bacterium RBG_16_56_8]|nr:MAG: septum site-determining protein MinD [Chloroflexi bacterium RBG_16_56_8]
MAGLAITITSGKGGVGKTTSTANIGLALAKRGKRVACLDTDIGLRNLDVVLGLENRIIFDIVDVIYGKARLRQALIKHKQVPGLQLLPAAQKYEKTVINEKQLIHLCKDLRKEFDFVLLDCPAGIEHGYRNAIAPADEIIIVTTPEMSALRDADRVIGLVEAADKPAPKLIVNRYRPHLVKRGDMIAADAILGLLKIDLLGIVPEDEAIIAGTNIGEQVALNSHSKAGDAYNRIAQRMLGEDVPIHKFDEPSNLLELFRFLRSSAA